MPLEINEDEYNRLFEEKIKHPTPWMLDSDVLVDLPVNNLFEKNMFLWRIVFDEKYDILTNNHQNKLIGNLKESYFNNGYPVTLKNSVFQIDSPEIISGIINFPYISWLEVNEFITKVPDNWTVFVINPILMKYHKNSIGLFLTPKYSNNEYINEFNDFIQIRTGYPLFLTYVNKDSVTPIEFNKPKLTLESYVKDMKKYGKNKGLSKLLDFWAENDCVKVDSFENTFEQYKDNLSHLIWHDINFKAIKSFTPFKLIHEKTGEELGPFKKFIFDSSFKQAETDNGVLNLTTKQVNDLIEGNYDFKLIE